MKEVILMVGPQGAGKTTYIENNLKDYFRISQDEQGPIAHLKLYQSALLSKDKIVIDRINHTREQRQKYLGLAKEAGFSTTIIVLNQSYSICFNRLLLRTSHPTLDNSNPEILHKALSLYFNQYEYVIDAEADSVKRLGEYDPYLLDITNQTKNRRVILIGDVHGCFDELQALLTKVKYVEGEDVVIFTGDLVDRGPKIREVLDFVRHTPYVYSVMSNHEHKYLRYLRGNKVNTFSLRETRSQVIDSLDTRMFLESLPYIIKWDTNNYVVHAGIHPEADITNQRKDILLYARTYNPKTNNFTEEGQRPWYEFPIRKGYKIYFGHQITDIMDVASSSYALDGGCVHGGELRGLVISADRQEEQLYIQPSSFKYKEDTTTSLHYSLEPYEALVSQGYLSKQEKNNKVLYKYTDKTTFEKHWNEYTRSARGIIFDKETGACLARPFKKFFNINEMPETSFSKLPNEAYQIFEKMDGSLGITYWENNNPILATCGSFNSDQAIKGTQILRKKYDFWMMDPQYTYLFEIIYPSNKIVVNYGDTEELVLLSAFNTKTGEEVNREWLTSMSVRIGCPLVSVHNLDIQQALTLQKTLPKDREGFIVRYNSGLRIKIKGAEYLRYHRIISGLTPLNIWRELKEGILPLEYKMHIPEEVLSEVEVIEQKLSLKYEQVKKEIENEINTYFSFVDPTNLNKKEIGLKLKEVEKLLKHPIAIFPYFLGKGLETYIMKAIEPKANIL